MKNDLPIGDIIFYGIVTAVFMGISAFGAFEGWYGSALSGFDGPRVSSGVYVTLAAFYGSLCSVGCSTPFLLVFVLALGLGPVTNRRITTIWIAGNVSTCLFAAIFMSLELTLSVSGEGDRTMLLALALAAAAPPGLQGQRLIIHIARNE